MGWSAIDAAAITVNRVHAARTNGNTTGVLVMHFTSAFQSIAKGKLVNDMTANHKDGDLI